ncbi:EF-hand domain-containing protein [Verrucomicrobiaceae bacterium N1E253]|uniref:EF-hand domain-containing protein n=1 Tax=Oceaniferula marina TaxID=2748318 RepID=A0A851GBR4_9BACT|nr:EF-hand domain-containing protein [Oceaniferula marina]NWK54619.1 EF-hand domain-containing protein [Oceaniferula marina]
MKCFLVMLGILCLSHVHVWAALEEMTPEQKEKNQRRLFADFDGDHNGKLSKQEFVDVIITRLFRDFDQNKDGTISRSEFFAHARDKKKAEQEYPIMDRENKGYIRKKDVYRNKALIENLKQAFRKLDTKGKGYVTLADLPDLTPEDED